MLGRHVCHTEPGVGHILSGWLRLRSNTRVDANSFTFSVFFRTGVSWLLVFNAGSTGMVIPRRAHEPTA